MDTGQSREYFRAGQFHANYEGVTLLEYAAGEGLVPMVHALLLEGVDARRVSKQCLIESHSIEIYKKLAEFRV